MSNTTLTFENTPLTVINGNIKTTSLIVAKTFGKQHKDVIRKIENLDCSPEFNERNFTPVEYLDKKGEKRKSYEITKDGFMFLTNALQRVYTGYASAKSLVEFGHSFQRRNKHALSFRENSVFFYVTSMVGGFWEALCLPFSFERLTNPIFAYHPILVSMLVGFLKSKETYNV